MSDTTKKTWSLDELQKLIADWGGKKFLPRNATVQVASGSPVDSSQAVQQLQAQVADLSRRVTFLDQNAYVQVVTAASTDTPSKDPGRPTIFVGPGITGATNVQEYGDIICALTITTSGGTGGTTTTLWNGADTTSYSIPPDMSLAGWGNTGGTALKPDATNTGTPPGWTALTTVNGDFHVTANNQQITDYHITGALYLDSFTGVVVKCSQIDGGIQGTASGTTGTDRTSRAMYCQIGSDGLGSGGSTMIHAFISLYRCNVYRALDVVHPTGGYSATQVTYRDSFLHTPVVVAGFGSDPNADSHSDVIQWDPSPSNGTFGNLLVHHCTIRAWGISDRTTPKQKADKFGGQNDGNLTGSQNTGGATAANGLTTDGMIINSGGLGKDFTFEYCYFDGKPYGHFTTGPSRSQYSNINVNHCVFDKSSVHVLSFYDYVTTSSNYFTDGTQVTAVSPSTA